MVIIVSVRGMDAIWALGPFASEEDAKGFLKAEVGMHGGSTEDMERMIGRLFILHLSPLTPAESESPKS